MWFDHSKRRVMIHLLIPNAFRYPYISHLIFNAGGASFVRIDYLRVVKQLFTRGLLDLVTHPDFNVENVGETSADGLGWVWQFNVFWHYVLVRSSYNSVCWT